jgi:hypothetical protein
MPYKPKRTNAEHESYPQYSRDHFVYRLVRWDYAARMETLLREALAELHELHRASTETSAWPNPELRERISHFLKP